METSSYLYNSYLEVNLSTICDNYRRAARMCEPGTKILPVLKANAYGLGAVMVARALIEECGADMIAVSHIVEAIDLREHQIDTDILLLGVVRPETVADAIRYDLQIPVFTPELIDVIGATAREHKHHARVQIAVNTGLNRLGAAPGEELEDVLAALTKYPDVIEVTGVYTHFATGQEFLSAFAREQYDHFKTAIKQVHAAGFDPASYHACDSGASDWFPEAYGTHIRLARRLYMRHDATDFHMKAEDLPVEPASWRAPIVHIRTIHPGESIGYDRAVIADQLMKVALIGVGYGDGLYPGVIGIPDMVLVGDIRSAYLTMCMDQCFIDVTRIPCKIGDEVTLFGYSRGGIFLSAEEVGIRAGKDGCYLYSLLTDRVKRLYVR